MTTPMAKRGDVKPRWLLVDAEHELLGRAAARIATLLQGKHRPTWTPHVDTGDFVVVINAARIHASGKKETDKVYQWFSGYHGGRKLRTMAEMRAKHPENIIRWAVRRMLPKTRLGRAMLSKLKVYPGASHPHAAQNPQPTRLGTFRSA